MSYSHLEYQVIKFENYKKKQETIQKFARTVGALLVLVGMLTLSYGVLISFMTSEEEAALLNVPLISNLWKFLVNFEASVGVFGVFVIGAVITIVIPILLTGIFSIALYHTSDEIQPSTDTLTLENVSILQKRYEAARGTYVSNSVSNVSYWLCAVVMFGLCGYQITASSEARILLTLVVGGVMSALFYIGYFLIRSLFIAIAKPMWEKEEIQLIVQLKHDFENTTKDLKKAEEQRKRAEKQEKERKQKEEEKERKKEEKRIQKENLAEAKKLYQEAIAGEEVDLDKLSMAAALGNPDAVLIVAGNLFMQAVSDEYTKSEQKNFYELAYKALSTLEVYNNHSADTKFLYLFVAFQLDELDTEEKCRKALDQLRKIQKSGELTEEYSETCSSLIRLLVKEIDKYETPYSSPATVDVSNKRLDCVYRNAGLCTKKSNSAYVAHCNYVNQPAVCPDSNCRFM